MIGEDARMNLAYCTHKLSALRKRYKQKTLLIVSKQRSLYRVKLSSLDQQFLDQSREIVLENLSNSKFSVSDLSSRLHFSQSQLYRKLKSVVNQSPNEYIRTVRLNQAAALLMEGEFSISEITYKVGYNDLKYFRLCFKKQFGQTPTSYKSEKGTITRIEYQYP